MQSITRRRAGFVLTTCLALCAVPAIAGALSAQSSPELEPNDVPSLAVAVIDSRYDGDINDAFDPDDVYMTGVNDYNEVEVRLIHAMPASGDPDIVLNLYPPGTPDDFSVPTVDMAELSNSNAQFIRYTAAPGQGGNYFIDVLGADTGGQVLNYNLDISVNDAADISGVERYWGPDRYSTALETSARTFRDGGAPIAVLATGENFPDALAASGLAGTGYGPLLLTRPSQLPEGLIDELTRLQVGLVYVVGGTRAVSPAVLTELQSSGFVVERISGDDRYQTAAKIAEKIITVSGGSFTNRAFVVRGNTFPDALAAAPFSYSHSIPILLTPSDSLHPESERILDDNDIATVFIAGGVAAVSAGVETEIEALNGTTTVHRMQGDDRYGTAAVLADAMVAQHHLGSFDEVGIATGRNFPDALAGGAAMGYEGGVMLLTQPDALYQTADTAMQVNMRPGDDAIIFGGESAISSFGAMQDVWGTVLTLMP